MKKITLKNLTLRNFKSIKNLSIEFSEKTNIRGKNGSGKTTIFDGFNWLLFGKNSENSTDFNLKPLDKHNNPVHNLETEVEGTFFVDGETIVLKRIYREKWTKKKGNEVAELTGHETSFFFNGVPCSLGEYKTKVQEIIDEELSKTLTNALYFNTSLKWNQRREILSKMAGEISEASIIDSMTNADELKEILNAGRNLEDEKKTLSAKKKKIKEELEQIPSRIDEVQRTKPAEVDFEQLQAELDLKEVEFSKVDEEILDSSKLDQNQQAEIDKKQNELLELKNKLSDAKETLRKSIQDEIDKLQSELSEINSKKSQIENEIQIQEADKKDIANRIWKTSNFIEQKEIEIQKKRDEWNKLNETQFQLNQNDVCCPTCKRDFENAFEKKEELEANFNKNKQEQLSKIRQEGINLNEELKNKKEELEIVKKRFEEFKIDKIEEVSTEKLRNLIQEKIQQRNDSSSPEIIELKNQINSFVLPTFQRQENTFLIQKRNSIKTEIEALKTKVSDKFLIEKVESRTKELIQQQKTLSSEIASLEKIEMQIEKFNHLKIDLIEKNVNSKFVLVKFKMFENQLNGGISENCVCMINGVPFSDLNTASKINAGIDIINALNYHFNISAPIFIDGRESVTELINSENQIVSLIVDPNCIELTF